MNDRSISYQYFCYFIPFTIKKSCTLIGREKEILPHLYLQMLCFVIPFKEDDGFALLLVAFLQRRFVSFVQMKEETEW